MYTFAATAAVAATATFAATAVTAAASATTLGNTVPHLDTGERRVPLQEPVNSFSCNPKSLSAFTTAASQLCLIADT